MAKPKRRAHQRNRQAARPIPAQHEPPDVARHQQPPSQHSVTEMLERLKRGRSAWDEAEAELDMLVDRGVDLGIGWPEIAVQLGVTKTGREAEVPAPAWLQLRNRQEVLGGRNPEDVGPNVGGGEESRDLAENETVSSLINEYEQTCEQSQHTAARFALDDAGPEPGARSH